jgi:glucuronoarabinoxylan endo-1,4-beta-xylanase
MEIIMSIRASAEWNETFQEMDGFGVCGAFRQADNLYKYPEEIRSRVLDILFSTEKDGAGFSIVRNIIGDSGIWGNETDGPTKSIEPSEGGYNFEGDEDQIWFMKESEKRGCHRFISSVWSPPAWMKTNNCVTDGGELRKDKYRAFANYLARYIKEYSKRYNIDIYAISPSNEPNFSIYYSSCLWSGEQFAEFYREHLEPVFMIEGITVKTFGPETEYFGNEVLRGYGEVFEGRCTLPQIVAQHGYGGTVEQLDESIIGNRKVWLTEISDTENTNDPTIKDGLRWAKTVHHYVVEANLSAFVYFWGMSKYYDKGISLIGLNLEEHTVIVNKRVFAIGNFSRFIRPRYVRMNITPVPCEDIYLSAFKNDKNEFVIVVINDGEEDKEITVEFNSFSCTSLIPWRTSENENLEQLEPVVANGHCADILIARKSITSFTGTAEGQGDNRDGS